MKKLIILFLVIAISFSAFAKEKRINLKRMSPQQRKEYIATQEADWNKKTKEQKLAFVEAERTKKFQEMAARIRKQDAEWRRMSVEDKIATHDEKLDKMQDRVEELNGKKHKPGC